MPVSSWVNSVEFIDATITGSNNSSSYALSKGQNYTNCIPFFTVCGDSTYWDNRLTDVYFSGTTKSGIINFARSNNRATSNYIKCYVVEFNPEQVRVQQGSFSLTGLTTTTVTLPTTISGTDRAAMTFGWKSDNTYQYPTCIAVRGRVLNTTSIDFYRYASTSTCTGHWFLFEDLQNNFRTYHIDSNHTTTGQTLNISGQETVDPLRTFVLGSYTATYNIAGASMYWSTRIFLYSIGTVRSDRNNAGGTGIYWAAQIIEILDQTKIYVPMDHSTVGWTTPTTYSRSVGGVSGRVPFVCNPQTSTIATAMMQGSARMEMGSNTESMNSLMVASEITASGTITHTKFGTAYASYPSYTVAVDWAGISVDAGFNPSPISEGNGPNESFVKSVENFRFTLTGNLGVYVLTKGQVASNCAIFSSNRSVSSYTLNTICVNTYIKEPGLVYMQHWSDTEQAIVDVSVIEFYPNQVKVQQFNVNNFSSTTTNVIIDEISSVNKAFILSSVFTPDANYISYIKYAFSRIGFTSTTNVELYKYAISTASICSFFIVEDLQNNFITNHTTQKFSSNDSFYNDLVNWGSHNSFPIVTYTSDSSDDYPYFCSIRSYYYQEFRPIYCDKANSGYNVYWSGTIVKFIDDKHHTMPLSKYISSTSISDIGYYTDYLRGTPNITAYNPSQYSTMYCNSSYSAATSESFGTVRITNYDTGEYEISKGGASYLSYMGVHFINWVGYHYQDANNITGTQTKSFINSIQRDSFSTDAGLVSVWLRYGQDITKCVPFICNSGASSDGYQLRLLKSIYRYSDPDCFTIRFGSNSTANRKILPYIVEFNQDIKVQYGSGYALGTSKTFTIESVNLNRAFLQFYAHSDAWNRDIRPHAICGYFSSSTELSFTRNYDNESMYISWYVVECPDWGKDSYWTTYHNITGILTGGSVYSYLTTQPSTERSIYLVSYAHDEVNGYPYFGYYRVFHRQDFVNMDRSNGGYNITASNVEVIEFSPTLVNKGLKVYSNFYTLSTTNPLDISLKLNTYDNFHIQRSMLLNDSNQNITRVETSDYQGLQEGYHYLEFKDTVGSGYSNTITASKVGSTYTSYGFYNAIQFPRYNKYYFSGYVTEQGNPVVRKLAAYKTSSGELTDTTLSISGTGYFYLETTDYEAHHIVAIDDDEGTSYNNLIYGKVYPTAISGAFAWVADYATVSGIGEYTTT